ncbi:DUF1634 domain-containing protein [Thermus tenuipuniceus]|uniref:DUF1634 domain-containing protein n=1 Tax=Thermus tenuipuniceus TaxID=2078690 RepID=UPI000CF8D2BB|nr:DUF1634 domain-containing protein [Thermus tenuipuniceus]
MRRMDLWISWTLRVGVLLSALLVFLGGLGYLAAHGGTPAGVASSGPWSIWPPSLDPLGFLQLGLLLLILTPVARVALALGLYLEERDWTFALITFWVLLVLLGSLLGYL